MLGEVDFSKDDAPKIHFSNLAKEFSNLGFDVLCLVYTPRNSKYNLGHNNFSIRFLPNPLTGNLFSRCFKYSLLLPIILGYLLKFSPEIIYIRFSPPVFAYLLALKVLNFLSFNFTVILEFNSWVSEERKAQGENNFKVEVIDFLQIKSASLADYNRAVTSGLKSRLKNHGIADEKIVVIGNGTDILHFKPVNKSKAKETLGLDPDSLYVGFIGNFAIWQGTETLIRTIPEVWKNYPHIRFLLVGNGPEMPKIRTKVSQINSEKVILPGYVPYEKANLYINAFDIGVAPFIRKRNEKIGLSPLKIRDYTACGV
ncbi:MAG: glycosyltransferase, partial [candidate division WOR-3 bacterium]